jgi:hypothetical protein
LRREEVQLGVNSHFTVQINPSCWSPPKVPGDCSARLLA